MKGHRDLKVFLIILVILAQKRAPSEGKSIYNNLQNIPLQKKQKILNASLFFHKPQQTCYMNSSGVSPPVFKSNSS